MRVLRSIAVVLSFCCFTETAFTTSAERKTQFPPKAQQELLESPDSSNGNTSPLFGAWLQNEVIKAKNSGEFSDPNHATWAVLLVLRTLFDMLDKEEFAYRPSDSYVPRELRHDHAISWKAAREVVRDIFERDRYAYGHPMEREWKKLGTPAGLQSALHKTYQNLTKEKVDSHMELFFTMEREDREANPEREAERKAERERQFRGWKELGIHCPHWILEDFLQDIANDEKKPLGNIAFPAWLDFWMRHWLAGENSIQKELRDAYKAVSSPRWETIIRRVPRQVKEISQGGEIRMRTEFHEEHRKVRSPEKLDPEVIAKLSALDSPFALAMIPAFRAAGTLVRPGETIPTPIDFKVPSCLQGLDGKPPIVQAPIEAAPSSQKVPRKRWLPKCLQPAS